MPDGLGGKWPAARSQPRRRARDRETRGPQPLSEHAGPRLAGGPDHHTPRGPFGRICHVTFYTDVPPEPRVASGFLSYTHV